MSVVVHNAKKHVVLVFSIVISVKKSGFFILIIDLLPKIL